MISDEDVQEVEEKILELYEICAYLGWSVSLNTGTEYLEGMVIGKHNYLLDIMSGTVDFDEYETQEIIIKPSDEEIH